MTESYRDVLGSDVINDGMYLELRNESDAIVACVFRSDVDGHFEISHGPSTAPTEVVARFVERAKTTLVEHARSVTGPSSRRPR